MWEWDQMKLTNPRLQWTAILCSQGVYDVHVHSVLAVSVIVPGHLISSMGEGSFCLFLHLCHAGHKGIGCFDGGGAGEFGAQAGVLACVEFEGGVVGGSVDVVIVCKLGNWQPVGPIVLVVVNEHTEVGLNFLVDMLCLAIGLWMVGGGRGKANSKECC